MEKGNNLILLLTSNGVCLHDRKKNETHEESSYKKLFDHIDNIIDIQNILLSCTNPYILGIQSNIWRDIECFKMWNRRGRYVLNKFKIKELEDVLLKAEKTIEILNSLPYTEMINRSMRKNEICVGKPYSNNIWREERLNVIDISKISFNLLEFDCYKFLGRLKRRGEILKWNEMIGYFVEKHQLDKYSNIYILALLSYPYDSMKYIQRLYFEKSFNEEEVKVKLKELSFYDGDFLI